MTRPVKLRTLGLLAIFLYAVIWQNDGWEALAILAAFLLGGRYVQWTMSGERDQGRLADRPRS